MLVPTTESIVWMCLIGLAAYVVTGIVLIGARLRYERRLRAFERVEALLNGRARGVVGSPIDGRRMALDALARMPLRDVRLLAHDVHTSRPMMELLAQSILTRIGTARVLEAARSPKPGAARWRRIAALRTLTFAHDDQAWDCLERALADGSRDVKAAAVVLLGQMGDTRSAALLVAALRAGSFARSRIAASLDAFPIDVGDLVVPLIASDDALVRFWGTTLMQRYPQTPGLARQLIALTDDAEPMVRKAAIDAIVAGDYAGAVRAVRARLADEVPFVRAHAARSLGRMCGPSESAALLPLLADRVWTVRDAAKETLSAMGAAIAPSVLPFLTHADNFARNSAAEVLQNVGVFERLLMLEAEGPSDAERAHTLRLLVRAGGAWMRNGVIERLNTDVQPRARQVLASMDVESTLVQGVA